MIRAREIADSPSSKDERNVSFQQFLLQLSLGAVQGPLSTLKKLKGNPLHGDLLASLKHSPLTKGNFAEIDFSRFDFGEIGSPLKQRLLSIQGGVLSSVSKGRPTETSIHTCGETISEADQDDGSWVPEYSLLK